MITQEQQEAIQTPNEHKLIVSLAGSGKTFTFVSLAETILNTNPSSKVLLMTFTNAAAGEIGERLKKRLDSKSYLRSKSATYASLMMQQFKPLKKGRRCIIGAEQYSFLKRAVSVAGFDIDNDEINDLMLEIEAFGRDIDSEVKADCEHSEIKGVYSVYLKYCQILRSNNCYDINMMSRELIFAIREGVIKPYPHDNILCDEFQDSDSLQYLWLREHGLAGAKIACVADDDQSIYNFRGGLGYKAFLQLQDDFDPHLYYLSKTFRCAKKILASAKSFIENNQDRMQKAMESAVENEGKVFKVEIPVNYASMLNLDEKTRDKIEVDTGKNKEEETESKVEHYRFVAESIKVSEKTGWAVLARTNRQLDSIERALSEHGLSVVRVGGKSIFDNIHAVSMVNLFYGLINDKASSELVSGLSWASKESEKTLTHISKVSQIMGFSAVSQIGGMEWSKVTAYLQELSQLAKMCNESHAVRFIDKWNSTVERIIANQNDKEKKLQITVLDIITKILKGSRGDLAARAANLVNKTKKQQKDKVDNNDDEVIVLSTMNSSKGLEWPRVWIIDMEEGLVPSLKDGVSLEAIEEERRLVYVAMTRAEEELYISWREGKESMFIEEIEGVLLYGNDVIDQD
mgnify:CR=1 FL=1|jgi:DNA helicase-2/ATP-dependent DNA helicase PcrA|tara:strand:- start:1490 stop:3379 length:1890 start_codon:yes stop_codon:yes gene_type:complete